MKVPIVWTGFEGRSEAEQWVPLGDGRFLVTVKRGDVGHAADGSAYSEVRALKHADGVRLEEGDVCSVDWTTQIPVGESTYFPKPDQQDWPRIYLAKYSIVEVHDGPNAGPPMNGDWSKLPPGGATIYTFIGREGHGIQWPAPLGVEATDYFFAYAPLILGKKNTHSLIFKTSEDPKVGWLGYMVNGLWVVGAPGKPLPAKTKFKNTYNYVMGGAYSRGVIGDPSLPWVVDPKPGVVYPAEFTPKKGARVFPRDDGYPRTLIFGDAMFEKLAVDATLPGGGTVAVDPVKAEAWRVNLVATTVAAEVGVGQISAQIALLQRVVDSVGALQETIKALSAIRDSLANVSTPARGVLNQGP
jgi:hypothetical protein